jgi:hypothetical protein
MISISPISNFHLPFGGVLAVLAGVFLTAVNSAPLADDNVPVRRGESDRSLVALPPLTVDPNLVSYFPCDETGGTIVHDSIANNSAGSLTNGNGSSWAPGKFGNALCFDGARQYATIPNSAAYNYGKAQSYTLAAWIFLPSIPTKWMGVLAKVTDRIGYYGIWVGIDGGIAKWVFGTELENIWGAAITKAGWHHIVAVHIGGQNMKIYADGALIGQSAAGRIADASSDSSFILGAELCPPQNKALYFNGMLDEFRLYNKAFDAAEVSDLFALVPSVGGGHEVTP